MVASYKRDKRDIKPIETYFDGYRFRSRLEARWAVFFSAIGLDYEYEIEGFEMEDVRYLPDFYIPSLDRWFEVKGQPLSVEEIKKCEQFCCRKNNEKIKFSILIGAPALTQVDAGGISVLGVREFVWEWPCNRYPENVLMQVDGLVKEEYPSRFLSGIWKVPNVTDQELINAVKRAREARFEFGEMPKL